MGPFLLQLIHMAYDRFSRIEKALDVKEFWDVNVLSSDVQEALFFTTSDFVDACNYGDAHGMNQRFMSKLIDLRCPERINKKIVMNLRRSFLDKPVAEDGKSLKRRLFRGIKNRILYSSRAAIVLSEMSILKMADVIKLKFQMGWQNLSLCDCGYFSKEGMVFEKNNVLRREIVNLADDAMLEKYVFSLIAEMLWIGNSSQQAPANHKRCPCTFKNQFALTSTPPLPNSQ